MKARFHFILAALVLLSISTSGCVMADQSGQAVPHDVYQAGNPSLGEISFHFRATVNYLSILGRTLLLLAVLILWRRLWTSQNRQLILHGVFALASAGSSWFLVAGASKVCCYTLSASDSRLVIQIPFHNQIDVGWDQVIAVSVKGQTLREGFETLYTEWDEMQILLADGRREVVNLTDLGTVQRSNFLKALQHRSKMRSIDSPL